MSKVTVFYKNGEMEVFNNVEITTMYKFTSLKSLEERVMTTGKGFKDYIDILKHACGICKDEYTDSIEEIIDQVYIVTAQYQINDRTFSTFFIDMFIEEDNNWSNILDSIRSFIEQDGITIFDGAIYGINWLNNEVFDLYKKINKEVEAIKNSWTNV